MSNHRNESTVNHTTSHDKFTCRLDIQFSDQRLGEFARLAKQGVVVDDEGLISLKGKELVEYALMAFAAKYNRKGARSESHQEAKETTQSNVQSHDVPKGLGGLKLESFLGRSK